MTALAIIFWVCAGLLVYTHLGYPLLLVALGRMRRQRAAAAGDDAALPSVTLIVAAYAEEAVIAARVANLRALDYPAGAAGADRRL